MRNVKQATSITPTAVTVPMVHATPVTVVKVLFVPTVVASVWAVTSYPAVKTEVI